MNFHEHPSILFLNGWFDKTKQSWESKRFMKLLAGVLVITYLVVIILIELKHYGYIHLELIPQNHFKSIELAFTLLLFFEVISLVFSLVQSISKSMEVQIQIMSIILLRDAFKLFGEFPENYTWPLIQDKVIFMFIDAFGALLIFIIIIMIQRLDKHQPIFKSLDEKLSFVSIKKIISLILLVVFVVMIGLDLADFFIQKDTFDFFHIFFTFLIFIDILLVFIALRYSNSYLFLFRNSGYAIATIIMRLSLGMPQPYNMVLSVLAAIFVLSLVAAYNRVPVSSNREELY
ncbi:MAG: hypothetical protein IH595_05205 [Bacteroidales bacterium]|nr:hypothetical protein [Bacteroidales bacterium]